MTAKHLRLREESGYSLIEVMVAIIIMTLAILPMMSMFDMGLNSTIEGSKYDKARMLANLKLEQAKNLPFDSLDDTIQDVRDNFPEPAGTVTAYDGSGYYQSGAMPAPPGNPTSMTYVVEKQYMAQPSREPTAASENWRACDPASTDPNISCDPPGTNLIRVTVTVQWDDGNTYTTHGLVAGS